MTGGAAWALPRAMGDHMKLHWVLACTTALLVAGPATAAVTIRDVEVKNASFEKNKFADGAFGISNIDDWTIKGSSATAGVTNPTAAMLSKVPDGENVALLNSYLFNGEERAGSMGQTLAETVKFGTLYAMTIEVGRRFDVASVGQWVAELLAGDTVAATGTVTDGQIASGGFTPLTVSFTGNAATAGKTLGVRFRSVFDATSSQQTNQVVLDQVRVTAASETMTGAVPEPATWMMMLGGFAVVGASMRRRSDRRMSLV